MLRIKKTSQLGIRCPITPGFFCRSVVSLHHRVSFIFSPKQMKRLMKFLIGDRRTGEKFECYHYQEVAVSQQFFVVKKRGV